MITSQVHSYSDGSQRFVGRLLWDDADDAPKPGILVTPTFAGVSPFEEARAHELAQDGYVALVVDYYGDGKLAADNDEAYGLMTQLNDDRVTLAKRMTLALDELKGLAQVDADRTGAMGYCFGGKAVLDLARTGADLRAVVSLHGLYDPPAQTAAKINAAVLILHGWDDPLAPPDQFQAIATELTASCDDWQALAFGHTGHAYTNPNANSPEDGMAYSETATARSRRVLTDFFAEKLTVSKKA